MEMCNSNVRPRAARKQLILKNQGRFGCSLWFAQPVACALHPLYFEGSIGFSSIFHEMAHNLTLNSPANYHFGGKTDGPMNCIVSETLAHIFQHAIIHQILNQPGYFGIPPAARAMIRGSGISSAGVVRDAYHNYLADTSQYATYNDPNTPADESFNTFMAVVYTFMWLADETGDYQGPTKRMMKLLQTFNPQDHQRFQQRENETFRATFLVAALSYGFDQDLRANFRKLNFPVDDKIYHELLGRVR